MIRQFTCRVLIASAVLLGGIAGCSSGASLAEEGDVMSAAAPAAESKVYLPEGFPETIMFPPGSVLRSASGGMPPEYASRSYLIDGEAPLSKSEMAEFFQTMLEKKGFEIVNSEEGYATVIWFTTPGIDEASVQIVEGFEEGGPTLFSLSLIMEREPE